MSRGPFRDELAPIRALIREKRVGNTGKCKISIALRMEEARIGGALPPGLTPAEIYRRLEPHWQALGFVGDEFPTPRQLKYYLSGH